MPMTSEMYAETGCAFVLQRMTKRLRPLVNKAYDADSHESRMAVLGEAREEAAALLHVLDALLEEGTKGG